MLSDVNKTICCTQCMGVFNPFDLEEDEAGQLICPHCETSEFLEDFNDEDEEE